MSPRSVFRFTEMIFSTNNHVRDFLSCALNRNVSVKKFVSKDGHEVYKTAKDSTGYSRIIGLDPKGRLISIITKTEGVAGDILVNILNKSNRNMTHIVNKNGKNIQLTVNNGSIKRNGIAPIYDSYENVNLIVKNNSGITKIDNPSLKRTNFYDKDYRSMSIMYYPKP